MNENEQEKIKKDFLEMMSFAFSVGDLRAISYELNIQFPSETDYVEKNKEILISELYAYCERRGTLNRLENIVLLRNPSMKWPPISKISDATSNDRSLSEQSIDIEGNIIIKGNISGRSVNFYIEGNSIEDSRSSSGPLAGDEEDEDGPKD